MRLARLIFACALALAPSLAFGQSSVIQGGPTTQGHVPQYATQGTQQTVVIDGGGAGGGAAGANPGEIGIVARGTGAAPYVGQGTGPLGTNICDYDAPTTNPAGYHYLCISANAQGGGLLAYGAGGAAAQLPLSFNINGTTYAFPFTVGGIVGPGTSVIGDLACWNNITGTLLKDCAQVTLAQLPNLLADTVYCNATGSPAGPTACATLPSPMVLGNGVTATTQLLADNSTKVATTAYVDRAATITVLPNGTTATTQTLGDATTKVATDQFVANAIAALPSSIRTVLSATGNFYVNASGISTSPCGAFTCQPGNDTNNCATIATPCQTIQHTVAYIASAFDFAGQTVNVQLADGTYNECVALPPYITTATIDKNVFIIGDPTVANVVVNCASGNTFTAVNSPQGWVIKNITAKASNVCLYADYHSSLYWDGGAFNACVAQDAQAVNTGAFIEFINHNYTTTTSKSCHVGTTDGGQVLWQAITVTITGSPTYSTGFECSTNNGIVDDTLLTISGSFTGPKYFLTGRPLGFSTGATASTSNSTQYIGMSSISSTETNYYTVAAPTNKIVGLVVNTTAAPGAGQTFVFTLRLGGGATALTCTVSGAVASSCSDYTHATTSITTGTVADLQVVSSAGAATAVMSGSVVMQ